MEIKTFVGSYIDERMYLFSEGKSAVLVDAVNNEDCWEYIKQNEITDLMVILTHEHIDHIYALNFIRTLCKCKVICSSKCAEAIKDPAKNFAKYKEVLMDVATNTIPVDYSCEADEVFENETVIDWMNHEIKLIETPGHSNGSICILLDNRFLFSGDTLIRDHKTITRLPGGSRRELKNVSFPILMNLNKEITLFPGHGETVDLKDIVFENKI